MRLLTTKRFERDLRLFKRRGKDLDKLWTVVDLLAWKYASGDGANASTSLRVSGRGTSPG